MTLCAANIKVRTTCLPLREARQTRGLSDECRDHEKRCARNGRNDGDRMFVPLPEPFYTTVVFGSQSSRGAQFLFVIAIFEQKLDSALVSLRNLSQRLRLVDTTRSNRKLTQK